MEWVNRAGPLRSFLAEDDIYNPTSAQLWIEFTISFCKIFTIAQGEKWRRGYFDIPAGGQTAPYNLAVEGTAGANGLGSVAVDDLTLADGACRVDEAVGCDFELVGVDGLAD